MKRIIEEKKSIIVAADVDDLSELEQLSVDMRDIPGISAFKIGFTLAMQGLSRAVDIVQEQLGADFPLIYDHQKAGNDIPAMGAKFAKTLKGAGINTAILFPFTGPVTQKEWTRACFGEGLHVITGGMMTHPALLVCDGGYVDDGTPKKIYMNACKFGCRHFVVPGNKIEWVEKIRGWLVEELGEGSFVLYAPGFIEQMGNVSQCDEVAGKEWHAIVGSGIYKKKNTIERREAAKKLTKQIVG